MLFFGYFACLHTVLLYHYRLFVCRIIVFSTDIEWCVFQWDVTLERETTFPQPSGIRHNSETSTKRHVQQTRRVSDPWRGLHHNRLCRRKQQLRTQATEVNGGLCDFKNFVHTGHPPAKTVSHTCPRFFTVTQSCRYSK